MGEVQLQQPGRRQLRGLCPSVAAETGIVPVRDSKVPAGPSLAVSRGAWAGLVQ
ncbi:DUF397 domain-containing protein [Streptomyces bacillaris]|uniref:DUF397 domain-containing protein n=1 Tax=Streptomyces bacillaris TaxID=68179 RepID=UPI003461446C